MNIWKRYSMRVSKNWVKFNKMFTLSPWRIENSQHYILDVVFNEDASRIAMEDAVENMALFRRFVLNIVKQSNCGARSQRNKLKRAGWNDDYRAQLFFG